MSYGAHIFNLMNFRRHIYFEHGRIPDMRCHLLFVAPPGFCLDPKTSVMLADGSRKPLSEIEVGDELMKAYSKKRNVVLAKVERVATEILEIQPHDIKCSPEHLILTDKGWRRAGELKVGDRMATCFTYNDLRLLGFWIAEGRFEGKGPWTPTLSNTDQKLLASYQRALDAFGVKLTPRSHNEFACVQPNYKTYHENQFAKFLRYLGFRKAKAQEKFIPEELFTLPCFAKRMLCRGLWDGDGWKHGYATSSTRLANDLNQLLRDLNVEFSYYPHDYKATKQCSAFYIHKNSWDFLKRTARFEPRKALGFAAVKSIRKIKGPRYLIDITTSAGHFVANNVIVHNSKSFFMKQCFSEDFGILNTPTIKTTFQGSCTEAGFVGTIEKNKGTPIKRMGLAEEYKDGIVAIEEFTAITKVLEQKHSLTFEAQLNSALFGGLVKKRLASGSISYRTRVTLIAGTQIAKFDISGGLGRRLSYIYWVPSPSDFRKLAQAVREGENVPLDKRSLVDYRNRLMDLQKSLDRIRRVTFSDDLYDFLSSKPHFEILLYKKMALGYNLFTRTISPDFEVTLDARLKVLLKRAMKWREQLLADPEGAQVIEILKRHGGLMSKEDLQTELLRYSINWETSSRIIDKLLRLRKIRWTRGGKLAVV